MDAYLGGELRGKGFFGGHFRDPSSYREKAREVDERFGRREREQALSFLAPASDAAGRRLKEWVEGRGYLVATGQQPGLFAGPLYSLYKALSAIGLAATLERDLGRPVLPLFWIASEDHDWAEVDHAHVVDVENNLRTFRLPAPEGDPNPPVHRIRLGDGVVGLVEELLQTLPKSDFSDSYFELIRKSYAPGKSLSEGFQEVLGTLLGAHPLLFADAGASGLKEASVPILLRELSESEAHEDALRVMSDRLEREGHDPQVPILPEGINLFLEGPAGRDRLYRDGPRVRLHHAGIRLSYEEVRSRVENDPSVLSPNVLLRPVVESALFPTLSYVGGPGEVAYLAQTRPLFELHGLSMPVVQPRFSALLVEGKVRKVLEKFGWTPDALERPVHELATEIAREEMPDPVRKALGEIRSVLGEGAAALGRTVQEIDPTLKGPVIHARNAAYSAFADAEKKILQALKRENRIALEQVEKAQLHLFPMGKPQERVINPFYYLVRYGPDLVVDLADQAHVALDTDSA